MGWPWLLELMAGRRPMLVEMVDQKQALIALADQRLMGFPPFVRTDFDSVPPVQTLTMAVKAARKDLVVMTGQNQKLVVRAVQSQRLVVQAVQRPVRQMDSAFAREQMVGQKRCWLEHCYQIQMQKERHCYS